MSRIFTDMLWDSISDIFEAILKHPFVCGLTDGSLKIEQFKNYVLQDALFLKEFSKSLGILSSKATSHEWARELKEHAQAVLQAESSLHDSFFNEWSISEKDVRSAIKNPSNTAYTNYLLVSTSLLPFYEGMASVLPCYWLYLKVGNELQRRGSPNPLYKRWLDTYSSKEYEASVRYVLGIMNKLAEELQEE